MIAQCLTAVAMAAVGVLGVPNATDLEDLVLQARSQISTAEFELECDISEFGRSTSFSFHVWLDGDSIRGDKTTLDQSENGSFVEKLTFTKSKLIRISDETLPDDGAYVVLQRELDGPSDREKLPYVVPNPRLFGLTPLDTITSSKYASADMFLGMPNRKSESVVEDSIDGIQCWKVEFVNQSDETIRYWIAPTQAYSILRIEQIISNSSIVDRVDVTNALHSDSDIWFPESLEYRRHEADKGVTRSESVKIRLANINQPLDAEIFTLKGMDPSRDSTVVSIGGNPPNSTVGRWNGEEIEFASVMQREIPREPSRPFLVILGTAVLCFALGSILLHKYLIARSA